MERLPPLTRALLRHPQFLAVTGAARPLPDTRVRPERVMQFGTGAFLRGFFGDIIAAANARGVFDGSIVAIGSTGSARDAALRKQEGVYAVAVQGLAAGAHVDEVRLICAISRALSAAGDWKDVLALARSPELRLVVSNTTEVGLALVPDDPFGPGAPRSFPAKLARVLYERWTVLGADPQAALTILPCELVEHNGVLLRALVHEQAARWTLDPAFAAWLDAHCRFCNTLVDRIVPGAPRDDERERLEGRLGAHDELLTVGEPYRLFAIEGDEALAVTLGFPQGDPTVVIASDITPFRTRKVRVLNGGHTASVALGLLCSIETVRDLVTDPRLGRFVRHAIFTDIVPSLGVDGGEQFAHDVLDRFANPLIRHALRDITLHGTAKWRVRVVPSIVGAAARTGDTPAALALGFAAHLLFLRGDVQARWAAEGRVAPADAEGSAVREAWGDVDVASDAGILAFVRGVCSDAALWSVDLAAVPGFVSAVAAHLSRLLRDGAPAAVDALLAGLEAQVQDTAVRS